MSNYNADQMNELGRFGRVETLQPPYHLFRRDIEKTVLPYTAEHDIGVLAYGPLAHGLLSGRMTDSTTFDAEEWRSKNPDFTRQTFRRNRAVVERLKGFARERDITLPQLAVAWTLANPAVDVTIVGCAPAVSARRNRPRGGHRRVPDGPAGDRRDRRGRRAVVGPAPGSNVRRTPRFLVRG